MDKRENLPAGIYPTKVDMGEGDVPAVPEPDAPPDFPEETEIPRSQWMPEYRKYVRELREQGIIPKKPSRKRIPVEIND